MVIKNEEHRKFLLEVMQQIQYPGAVLDLAYEVKKEIEGAALESAPRSGPINDGAAGK